MPSRSHSARRRIALVILLALAVAGAGCRTRREREGPLALYVSDAAAVEREFVRFTGHKPDPSAAQRIERAAAAARSGDYRGAAALLDEETRNAGVPSLYTNLGVLYAAMGDTFNAHESFQAALRIDPACRPARNGLEGLKVTGLIADIPVTREVEPNNAFVRANRIALDSEVAGEVKDAADIDTYRVQAPRAPRDLLEITVTSRARALLPYLRIHDGNQRFALWNKDAEQPGATVTQFLSPEPEAVYYLEVWGKNRTAGAYALRVRPMKAYDAHEPNDDIVHATPVQQGARIEASLMDARDSDYYQFTSVAGGKVSIAVENRSATLVPAISVHGPDRVLIGFGPEIRQPGANLSHSITTVAGQSYYVQVWGQSHSSGAYALTVR